MARYLQKGLVQLGNVKLVLQDRIDIDPIFSCVCWRETRASSRTNRRFYFENGAYWRIPISQVFEIMLQAKRKGFFDDFDADLGKISEKFIIAPTDKDYSDAIGCVLVNGPYEDEWQKCVAVSCIQSSKMWRKVMMLSFETGYATFRSLSSDSSYKFFRNETTADGWKLDQAMLDAHPTAFLHWLSYLESRLI